MTVKDSRSVIWIGLLAIAAGLAFGTLILVFAELSASTSFASPLAVGYLIAANAFLIFVLLAISVVYADSRRTKQKIATRVEERMSQLLHHLDGIFYARTGLSAYLLRNQHEKNKLDACVQESSEFLQFLVDETRVMFENYKKDACAVSIKLLVAGKTGKPEIQTYLRDSKSHLIRKDLYEGNGSYPYEDHSPFVDIISGSGKDYYLCNDLRRAAAGGSYKNANRHWRKLYNATLVVAIQEPGVVSGENILGFLCIDSISAKFDEAISLYVARIIANTVFYVVYSLSVFESRRFVEKKAV